MTERVSSRLLSLATSEFPPQNRFDLTPIGAAQCHAGAIAKDDGEIAVKVRQQLLDPIDLHDRGTVDADESFGIELAFQPTHRLARGIRIPSDVQGDVVVRGFDPVDVDEIDHDYAVAQPDRQSAQEPLAAAGEIVEEVEHARIEHCPAVLRDAGSRTLQRLRKFFSTHRLEQKVEGVHLESAQCVAIERRHENDGRQAIAADRLEHVETVHLRHLDVEQHNVRRQRTDGRRGGAAVPRLADDVHVGNLSEEPAQPPACHGFIVYNQHPKRHPVTTPLWSDRHGMARRTRTPPPSTLETSIDWSGPYSACRRARELPRPTPSRAAPAAPSPMPSSVTSRIRRSSRRMART